MNNDYFNSVLIKLFPDSPIIDSQPVIKYHYTSPEAFLSIIKSHRIRFSDIRFMNDKSEGIYFIKLLLEFIENNRGKYPHTEETINLLLGENDFEAIKTLRITEIKYKDFPNLKYESDRIFLLCVSAKPDLLNMWNYYVHNNTYEGYSIGFSINKLLKTFDSSELKTTDPFRVYYGDVIYDEKRQTQEVLGLVNNLEKLFHHNSIKYDLEYAAIHLRQYIETRGYFFKHKSFNAEEEFRIIVSISQKRFDKEKTGWVSNMHDMQKDFFVRNGLIVPCFSIEIPNDAISRIYLSPTAEDQIAKSGVKELLSTTDYFKGIQTWKSNIPIRY